MTVTIDQIHAARAVLAGAIEDTPCLRSRTLSAVTGAEVFLKFENLQFTASFKERGALNTLVNLSAEERTAGVLAMSAGNHAQGLAYHAQRLGIPATIVMPQHTPYVKVRQTAHFGARIVLEGETLVEAAAFAEALAAREGLTMVHPYDDERVMAGQGTIALEMLEAVQDLDVLVIPIGGGGLISGMATAAKAVRPDIQVIGVEASRYASMTAALRGEEPQVGGATIAEGIAVKAVSARAVAITRALVDEVITVSEQDLERAVYMLLTIEKTVAEGAGAAGLAALLARPRQFLGRKVGLPICGGNIDPRLLASVIVREMTRDGRIARISIDMADSPGQLARVTAIVAEYGCSVIEVSHHRLRLDMSAKHAMLEMMIEARDKDQVHDIIERLRGEGFTVQGQPA